MRVAAALMLCLCIAVAAAKERAWTVDDSVAIRYFVTDLSRPGVVQSPYPGTRVAGFSPDNRSFFVLFWSGDLAADENVYVLSVYKTDDVRAALEESRKSTVHPYRTVTMRGGFTDQVDAGAIMQPKWLDNESLAFVGSVGREQRRIFRFDVSEDRLTPLTPGNIKLLGNNAPYVIEDDIVMFSVWVNPPAHDAWKKYPLTVLDTSVMNALNKEGDLRFEHHILAAAANRDTKVLFRAPFAGFMGGPWISPDGQWAIADLQPLGTTSPAAWREHDLAGWIKPTRFMLANFETGIMVPMVDAPGAGGRAFNFHSFLDTIGQFTGAFWSGDSRHALLVGTHRPLNGKDDPLLGWIAGYDVETGQLSWLDSYFPDNGEPDRPKDARRPLRTEWIDKGRKLAIEFDTLAGVVTRDVYAFNGRRWKREKRDLPGIPVREPDLKISIAEDANTPPRIAASDGQRQVFLTDVDPALEGIARAAVETLRWTDSEGEQVEALLMLPPESTPGTRPPLVVQLSDPQNPPNAFRPDGEPGTAFAAQPLAARGFAVLQLTPAGHNPNSNESDPPLVLTPAEGPAQVRRVDDAVRRLRERRVVSDEPIGLIGFSRSGFYAYYVATHPGSTKVGAVIAFDSITHGYGEYVMAAALRGPNFSRHYGSMYGQRGSTFWQNKQGWLDAPAFNLDRLATPMLFTVTGFPQYSAETIGAFKLARRPFEYFHYPDSGHMNEAPRQRAASMQATLDWMSFWLKAETPAVSADDPTRADRWNRVKSEWQAQQAWEAAGHPIGSVPQPQVSKPRTQAAH